MYRPMYRFAAALIFGAAVASQAGAQQPSEPETLGSLVAYALAHDPGLEGLAAHTQALREGVAPVSTWPDPRLMVGVTNVGATDWTVGSQPMAQMRVELSQRIPWRGTIDAARTAAKEDADVAEASLAIRRNDLAANVATAGLELYRLDKQVDIERSILDLYRAMSDAAAARVETGGAPQENLVNTMLEVETAEARIAELTARRPSLVARINALLNRPISATVGSISVGALATLPGDDDAVADSARARHPAIVQRRLAVSRDEARQSLAETQRIPDPVVGAAYGYRGDLDGVYSVNVGIPLPVHSDRRQNARVRMASETVSASRARVDAMEVEVAGNVYALLGRLRSTDGLRVSYTDQLLPRARQAVDATLASYSVGRTDLINVLDASRRLHRLRLESLNLEVSERTMFVTLEQLTGSAPEIASRTASFVR